MASPSAPDQHFKTAAHPTKLKQANFTPNKVHANCNMKKQKGISEQRAGICEHPRGSGRRRPQGSPRFDTERTDAQNQKQNIGDVPIKIAGSP